MLEDISFYLEQNYDFGEHLFSSKNDPNHLAKTTTTWFKNNKVDLSGVAKSKPRPQPDGEFVTGL